MIEPAPYSLEGKRVWVAGHRGMVGAAVVRRLEREGCEIVTASRTEVDLTRQDEVERWTAELKPQAIIMAAAKVGGILANDTYPVDFLYDNLMIAANVTRAAHEVGVEKMLFLGSSCIYPKLAPQPLHESALLTGPLEPTNEWYAIAKIAGIKLAQAHRRQFGSHYISAMPTNLYGPGDNFDLKSSHVVPALIRKAHEARLAGASSFEIWGTGQIRREFLHVDDCADALILLLKHYDGYEHVNVGSGTDVNIEELAYLVADAVGFTGSVTKDTSKPNGTPQKLLDISHLRGMGWAPSIDLPSGLRATYRWYVENIA